MTCNCSGDMIPGYIDGKSIGEYTFMRGKHDGLIIRRGAPIAVMTLLGILFGHARVDAETLNLIDPSYSLKGNVELSVARAKASGNALKADMSVGILPEHPGHLNQYLVLEGVTAVCDTVRDESGALWYRSIRSVDLRSGRLAAYECTGGPLEKDCRSISRFGLPSGRFWSEAAVDSIRLVQLPDNAYALEARGLQVLDDDGRRVRASAHPSKAVAPRFNSMGFLDTLFLTQEDFILRNVLGASVEEEEASGISPALMARQSVSGFSLRSRRTALWSIQKKESSTVHWMRLGGSCRDCGPQLVFEVKDPSREAVAFKVDAPLEKVLELSTDTYLGPYRFRFGQGKGKAMDTAGLIRFPQGQMVSYAGWNLRLKSMAFNARGVTLTSVDAALPEEDFPLAYNPGGAFAHDLQGLRIANPGDDAAEDLHVLGQGRGAQGKHAWVDAYGQVLTGIREVDMVASNRGDRLKLVIRSGRIQGLDAGKDSNGSGATTPLDSMDIWPAGMDFHDAKDAR